MLVMHRPTIEPLGEESNNRQHFAVGPLEPGFGHTHIATTDRSEAARVSTLMVSIT
jgi:hypothetical protein